MASYVITGAASGLGAATADRLHAAGHGVIGIDLAGSVLVSVNYFGAIDVLVGIRGLLARAEAASVLLVSSNSTTTQPGWPEELADICLSGDEAAACALADSYGEYGSVLTYPATKAALAYYARLNVNEYLRQGIRINAIAPGFIDTPMTQAGRADPQMGAAMDQFLTLVPAGRAGGADEIAAFLLGPEATTIAEIERGIVAKERSDAAQGLILRRWFDANVLPAFEGRVLPFDLRAARVLAGFRVPEHAPLDDALIAAVARAAGLVVVTRAVRRFEPLGVEVLNPWG